MPSPPTRAPSGARAHDGSAALSLDKRTNSDERLSRRKYDHRFKRIRYPDGEGEMVVTRYRKPKNGARKPVEHVDEDGVLTSSERPAKPSKTPTEVVMARHKSVNRTRTVIRRTIHAAGCDALLTLTFRRNETDHKVAFRILERFTRLMRQALGEFLYIGVAERQKRGAIHFHLAVKGWQDLQLIRSCWERAGGDGNIDIRKWHGPLYRMASYISKYVSKSFTDEELDRRAEHRYRRSKGIDLDETVIVASMYPAEAREAVERLFAEVGIVGHAVCHQGTPEDLHYYVWGCTWDTG
jgi:hypothetical protein